MNLFINHSMEEKNNEQIITLYIDKRFAYEEFGDEFLTKRKQRSLERQAKEYIKTHFPHFKGGVIKIAIGTMILVTIPTIAFAETAESDNTGNIEYTIQSESDTVSEEITPSTQPPNTVPSSDEIGTEDATNNVNENTSTITETVPDGIESNSTPNEAQEILNTNSNSIANSNQLSIGDVMTYTVKTGDTLTQISKQFNTSIDQLKSINSLTSDTIYVGQNLTIPVKESSSVVSVKIIAEQSSTNLYNGIRHPDVVGLKQQLMQLGFLSLNNPTTYFGPTTEKAIKDFQSYYGLQVDGIANKDTLDKLNALVNSPYQNGMRHNDNIKLKEDLIILNYLSLANPTNYFGNETERAVKQFQRDFGLHANGIADQKTLNKLEEVSSGPMHNGLNRSDVKALKQDLNNLGFLSISNPTTFFGLETEKAVKSFQNYYGLQANGVVGKETLNKLKEITNSPFQNGKRHESTIKLKEDLGALNLLPIENPTNYFGTQTELAVKQFQKKFRLKVTGIADQKTLNKIGEVMNGPMFNGLHRDDVIPLKKNLERLGFLSIQNPTTFFGPSTEKATKDFQRKYGLNVTGIADQATVQAIENVINGESLAIEAPLLKAGVHHRDVIKLKMDLEKVGFKVSNNPTDYYGPTTAIKVKEFQKRYNLTADGIAGVDTLAKLDEVVSQTIPSPFERAMFPNDSGEDVRLLQTYLNDTGYYVIDQPTTFYGTITVNQIKNFQQQNGLEPTGIADARTLQKLVSARESIVENISSFEISGKGYGHAVGMTQWGAYGMATEGYKYEDILKYYYTGTGIGERDTANQNVRVLLTEKADTLTISSNQAYQVGDKEFLPNSNTTILYQNGEYIIKNGDKTYKRTDSFQISLANGGLLYFDNKQYEGTFYVSTTNNKLDLVNHLNVENYLKGVIPYEIIPSWNNLDLFKVQTLAARTYVLKEVQRNQNNKFDVYDTVRSQVYNGLPKDIPEKYVTKINQAISETKGEVVLYNGVLIDAVYSASAGGHTVDAADVWGNSVPYLVGKEDPYDKSMYSTNWWSITLTKQDLETFYPEVGKVINLSVVQTKYNRPTEIKIVGDKKTITISGTEFRQKVGSSKMLSNTFTVTASVK